MGGVVLAAACRRLIPSDFCNARAARRRLRIPSESATSDRISVHGTGLGLCVGVATVFGSRGIAMGQVERRSADMAAGLAGCEASTCFILDLAKSEIIAQAEQLGADLSSLLRSRRKARPGAAAGFRCKRHVAWRAMRCSLCVYS